MAHRRLSDNREFIYIDELREDFQRGKITCCGMTITEIIDMTKENKELKKEIDDLKSQIKGFENDFDYQNKVIDKYKEDLKKLRVAYIQASVANVVSGTDFESILKSVLNGEFGK